MGLTGCWDLPCGCTTCLWCASFLEPWSLPYNLQTPNLWGQLMTRILANLFRWKFYYYANLCVHPVCTAACV